MLILPHSCFLHVPKTGGSWVTKAIIKAGVSYEDYRVEGDPHLVLKDCPVPQKFKFAFVRHPLDMYRSYWQFKMSNGWDKNNAFDMTCQAEHFHIFLQQVLSHYAGAYGILVSEFCGEGENEIEFIGRYENLVEDLIKALTLAGENFDEQVIRDFPAYNVSDKVKYPAEYTPELKDAIQNAEIKTIERFQYEHR